LVRTFVSLMLCGGVIAVATPTEAADSPDTITANYLLQCQKDPNACQVFTTNALRVPGPPMPGQSGDGKICAPLPLNRDQTNQLVQWILARPQQSTGHAAEDIAMAGRAIWPCK
jgi:hypothetical protein